jgi:anti-sigma regulatory factor (Ser/Thr protein kinase)
MGANLLDRPVLGSAVLSLLPVQPSPKASWGWRFGVTGWAPRWARNNTRWFLEHCPGISEDVTEDAVMVVSELMTNAYIAAMQLTEATVIDLSLRVFDDHLLIEVIDSSPETPVLNPAKDASSENGRGLYLVNELCTEWGYFWHQGKKVVFCILPLTCDTAD